MSYIHRDPGIVYTYLYGYLKIKLQNVYLNCQKLMKNVEIAIMITHPYHDF